MGKGHHQLIWKHYLFFPNESSYKGGLAAVLAANHMTPVHRLLSLVWTNLCVGGRRDVWVGEGCVGKRRDVWVGGGICEWEEGCVEGGNGCVGRGGISE